MSPNLLHIMLAGRSPSEKGGQCVRRTESPLPDDRGYDRVQHVQLGAGISSQIHLSGVPKPAGDFAVAQLQTNHYDEPGTQLQEERQYFAIPSSEPGTDGTHYDRTKYGYDSIGRQWREKDPHGTIYRTVFDKLGRVTERWIGTNDYSFSGGEPSGTDNMVKSEALEYDSGNDKGNSYLTKRTVYVQDSDTGKRETTFSNDLRGNVLLETSPAAPYPFHKVDNMSRRIAQGCSMPTSR
ncbi:MAG: hypothetical protein AB1486_30735 [Planctomycetota bacterium]